MSRVSIDSPGSYHKRPALHQGSFWTTARCPSRHRNIEVQHVFANSKLRVECDGRCISNIRLNEDDIGATPRIECVAKDGQHFFHLDYVVGRKLTNAEGRRQ